MERTDFIKLAIAGTATLSALPHLAFRNSSLSYKELIGKGHPMLYGDRFQIRKSVYDDFLKMRAAASKENIIIQIVSSYRNFDHQNRIWQRKYKHYTQQGWSPEDTIEKIIEYSTIPGTSRHHWGTDIDIVDGNVAAPKHVLSPSHFEGNGSFVRLKQWMDEHSNTYGFYLPYTNAPGRNGFKYEPWHYSYKPLSYDYLKAYRKLSLKEILKNESLMGYQYFTKEFLNRYNAENILDINPELL